MTFDRESCPPRDVLIDAGSPGATAEARERVADHLITCTACSEEFRLLQALAPWAEEHAHLLGEDARLKASRSTDNDDARLKAARSFEQDDARLKPSRPLQADDEARLKGSRSFDSPVEREGFSRAARWRAFVPSYAIAAVLAIVAVGLTVQVRRLQTENRSLAHALSESTAQRVEGSRLNAPPPAVASGTADLERRVADQQRAIADLEARVRAAEAPDVNPPIIDLEASDGPRSAAKPAATALAPEARHIVFVLNTSRRNPGATFDVELVDGADHAVWSGTGLKQSADGTLTLVVPRALVAKASRIRLYSTAANRRSLVEQYVLPATR